MDKHPADLLFSETTRQAPRKEGILPAQEIKELVENGKIRSSAGISEDQIQPASIDLTLGETAYKIRASFLPSAKSLIDPKVRELKLEEIDLSKPSLLRKGEVYIVRAREHLDLPADVEGKANPKSTTGRLDIFTRLLTEAQQIFEVVPKGYKGDLWVEIFPRKFPIVVKAGTKLNQLRLFRGAPQLDDEHLKKKAGRTPLVYGNGGSQEAVIRQGLRLTIDLRGSVGTIVAYKAKDTNEPIDLAKISAYNVEDFWDPFYAEQLNGSLVLRPGDFYLLASKEMVGVPPDYAAEMESYDPSIGEFTVHYAGFFDPGFGFGEKGEIKGTNAVLEVRAHEVPILLEDGREIGRLVYHKMAGKPARVYGAGIGSSYQQQHLSLSKQFKKPTSTKPSPQLQTSAFCI